VKLKQDGTPNKSTVGELKYKFDSGDVVTNNAGNRYKFIKRTHNRVWVEFLDHRKYCSAYPISSSCALSGKVKDWYAPSVYGVGVTGILYEEDSPIYYKWKSMLNRVLYRCKSQYVGCDVSEEFRCFENFYWWYKKNEQVEGYNYELDKDLFCMDSKLYSPETCCLLPKELHNKLYRSQNVNKAVKETSMGFTLGSVFGDFIDRESGRFFDTQKQALDFYWDCREDRLRECAYKWKDYIKPHVYRRICDFSFRDN